MEDKKPQVNKRKYIFPIVGVCILIGLAVGVFYALMFGKEVFQGSIGEANGGKSAVVQFDFQRAKNISGISDQ